MKRPHFFLKKRMPKADEPIPFGYKTSWLCVEARDPEEVAKALGLRNPRPANWKGSLKALDQGKVFITPEMRGYVLVREYDRDDGIEVLLEKLKELTKPGGSFRQVQCYASHRVVDYAFWAKVEDGKVVRAYGWCGEEGRVLINEGAVTPQEEQIGMGNPLIEGEEDWSAFDTPDEKSVIELAALWGIDPRFPGEYPKSVGLVCDR